MKRIGILIAIAAMPLASQTQPLEIPRATEPPRIDGIPDERIWQEAAVFTAFRTLEPDFGLPPSEKTELRVIYDEKTIYVAFQCSDRTPDRVKATLSDRDQNNGDDWVAFCLDTYNDELGAFFFLSNPLGIQMDGTLDGNADTDILLDMVWQSAGKRTPDGYTVEMAIPFSSLRFPGGQTLVMGFKAARFISRKSEEVDFPEFSPDRGAALTQFQKISFTDVHARRPLELIPSVTVSQEAMQRAGKMAYDKWKPDAGLTAKIGLGSSLTLDVAVNPDFAQVETDAGQIDVNLRNALYYTEKRPFFLERQEWFGLAATADGSPLQRLIHTRAIADPVAGLRLSGKLGKSGLISSLYALDEFVPEGGDPSNTHFGALRLARLLKADAYFGGIAASRVQGSRYYLAGGTDGRLRSGNRSTFEWHALGSRNSAETDRQGTALGLSWAYNSREWEMRTGFYRVSRDFSADFGYLTRTGLTTIPVFAAHNFLRSEKVIQRITPYYWSLHSFDHFAQRWETYNVLGTAVNMPRQTEISASYRLVTENFAGSRFSRNAVRIEGNSQPFNFLSVEASLLSGKRIYYDSEHPFQGRGSDWNAGIVLQPRTWLNIGLSWARSDFYQLETGEKIYDYTLYRMRTTVQFSKFLSFRTIAEYNAYKKQLNGNCLLSFTYIPGTVVYLGYGSLYEGLHWEDGEYRPAQGLLNTRQLWFFKASYLWRL
ncbi:MAG: carbohydrate binding family 9 domain-containing protein [Lewinellaceae bacterium]|nr:carbohydrate binding family 9 domain-containing protein [Lewinella sp.]MCB9281431.1 carbohydrate binding family 9 domain-containing protein [Lewinellaceae bacterium]